MQMCEEMSKLREWLDTKDIKWNDASTICDCATIEKMRILGIDKQYADITIYRTHFSYKGHEVSVINGYGTYGGYELFTDKNYGCLKMRIDGNEPLGWLSAENVIKKLERLK